MSRPPASSSRGAAPSPQWNITQTNSSSLKSFHILHRPATAGSTASPPPSRPQTAAGRLQRPSTAKSPFLSYNTAASPSSSSSTSTPVPFSLLDSINVHRASKGRATASNSSRPASAYGRRERRTPGYDSLVFEDDEDQSSATMETVQPQQQWKVRERQRHDRESEITKFEERKEADDSHTNRVHTTATALNTLSVASPSASSAMAKDVAMSAANRVPSSVAALATYTPQSFQHSPSLQHSIQLLHAAPLLASFLPSLTSLDTAWSSLIASHALYRQSESRQMAALREEELRIRDAMLTFMRVSMEYRRTETHDTANGRITTTQQNDTTHTTDDDGWLIRDDGQRTSIDVDWNGRYWQSERRREKEAWYRAEEREMQALYEHGVQLTVELYRHKFEVLMRLASAVDQRATIKRVDPHTTLLNTQLHETLTALKLQSTARDTTIHAHHSPSASASASADTMPPRHPSLSLYADRLYTSLNDLSTLLSSHYQHVVQVVEHCHTLTSASLSIEQLVRSLHDEERVRREEVETLKQDKRTQREEFKQRESEWETKLRTEQLNVTREREERLRTETQMAELKDTLARIQAKYEADWRRHQQVSEKGTQCEVVESSEAERVSESESKQAEDEATMSATARKLRSKMKGSTGNSARHSGKQNFQLNLTTPPSGSERLSPRSGVSPRSASGGSPPPQSPQSRSPRARGTSNTSSVFSFAAAVGGAAGGVVSAAAAVSAMKSPEGGSKLVKPALRGGAIADGTAKHSKTASNGGLALAGQLQASSEGKAPVAASADKQRWDGVPFV